MANRAHCALGVQNRTPQILSAWMAHEWNKFSRFQTERQQSSWSGKRLFDGDVSQSETIRQPTDNRRPFIEWLIFFVGSQDLSDPIPSHTIRSDPFRLDTIRSDPQPIRRISQRFRARSVFVTIREWVFRERRRRWKIPRLLRVYVLEMIG